MSVPISMTEILERQAWRDRSAAMADFWHAGSTKERRIALIWLRACDRTWKFYETGVQEQFRAMIRGAYK
jgi:hypothetical protein